MGEDLPLDPNQVQPPQEGQPEQSGHIEVDYQEGQQATDSEQSASEPSEPTHLGTIDHDDNHVREGEEGYVQDENKAREMAEAGDISRTEARANREGQANVGKYDRSLKDKTPEERAEFFDKMADKAEDSAGELYDEAQSSDYSHNPDKAKRMILAERGRERNLAAPTPREAGDRYDTEMADEQIGKPRAEALKEAPDYKIAQMFLRYSQVIAEAYRKHGDELTVNLKALELAAKSIFRHGSVGIEEYEFGKYVTISVNQEKGGAIDIVTGGRNIGSTTEKWHIPMFDDDPKGHRHTGTYAQPRDFAYYEFRESAPDPGGGFERVHTRKTRSLGEQDLANLDKLFGKVSAFKAAERANTLYPGDEGYEEELAEINYGRDL